MTGDLVCSDYTVLSSVPFTALLDEIFGLFALWDEYRYCKQLGVIHNAYPTVETLTIDLKRGEAAYYDLLELLPDHVTSTDAKRLRKLWDALMAEEVVFTQLSLIERMNT